MAIFISKVKAVQESGFAKKPKHTRHYIKGKENNSETASRKGPESLCGATGQLTQSDICTPVLNP